MVVINVLRDLWKFNMIVDHNIETRLSLNIPAAHKPQLSTSTSKHPCLLIGADYRNKACLLNTKEETMYPENQITFVKVMITGTLEVSNCRNSSSLTSTSGSSSDEVLAEIVTFGIPVSLKATWMQIEF